jgi:predicted MFS family arabinose efflux permease
MAGGSKAPGAVLLLYLAAFAQGLTLVSFPASSAVLEQVHGFTDAQYGAIFLPQVLAAVIGAFAGGALSARLGLATLLRASLLLHAASQLLLASTATLAPSPAFVVVLLGTACLGLAFGLSGAPLNSLPPLFFPRRRDTAIVAIHTLIVLGLAVGPIVADRFIVAGAWAGFPLSLALLVIAAGCATWLVRYPDPDAEAGLQVPGTDATTGSDARPWRSPALRLFAGIAMLYAFAEGTFSNWTVIYLHDVQRLTESVATGALSAFWAAMVTGRLLVSVLVLRVPAERIWQALPGLMLAAFLLLPYASTPALGVALFAFSGLACSAFFPLTIGIASAKFPRHVPWVSSMLIAALMIGVGFGTYAVGLLREGFAMQTLYRLSALYPVLVLVLAWRARRARPS